MRFDPMDGSTDVGAVVPAVIVRSSLGFLMDGDGPADVLAIADSADVVALPSLERVSTGVSIVPVHPGFHVRIELQTPELAEGWYAIRLAAGPPERFEFDRRWLSQLGDGSWGARFRVGSEVAPHWILFCPLSLEGEPARTMVELVFSEPIRATRPVDELLEVSQQGVHVPCIGGWFESGYSNSLVLTCDQLDEEALLTVAASELRSNAGEPLDPIALTTRLGELPVSYECAVHRFPR